MNRTTRLRQLIEQPGLLVQPGVFDPVSARLVEEAGFKAAQCTGFGIAGNVLGVPDVGILSLRDMVDRTRVIAGAVSIPVMADGDTGFGNAVNVHFTVRALEDAGAAGVNLEDQIMPKRCGHMAGKELVPAEEMQLKILAAHEASRDPDFVINARTDALAVEGIDGAIDRANLYLAAGATMAFIDGTGSLKEVRRLVCEIDGPVAVNIVEGGRSAPDMTLAALEEAGVARVSLPLTAYLGAIKGMRDALSNIREMRAMDNDGRTVDGFEDALRLVGINEVRAMERRYLPAEQIERKYGGAGGGR